MISRNNSFDNLQNSRMRRRYDQNEISSVLEKAINLDNWSRSFPIWGYQRNVSRWITAVFGRKSVSKCTIWVLRERDASNENKERSALLLMRLYDFSSRALEAIAHVNVKPFSINVLVQVSYIVWMPRSDTIVNSCLLIFSKQTYLKILLAVNDSRCIVCTKP